MIIRSIKGIFPLDLSFNNISDSFFKLEQCKKNHLMQADVQPEFKTEKVNSSGVQSRT